MVRGHASVSHECRCADAEQCELNGHRAARAGFEADAERQQRDDVAHHECEGKLTSCRIFRGCAI
jgi:hypothetical protein